METASISTTVSYKKYLRISSKKNGTSNFMFKVKAGKDNT
jgi:hypothetical protein